MLEGTWCPSLPPQELRLLTWTATAHGCLQPSVLEAAVSAGLLRVLLLYVNPADADAHPAVRTCRRAEAS
jgi:hypothetical protein